MAEKSGLDETPVELQLKVARTRELVVRDASGLRYELNFPLKLKRAFQRNTVVGWARLGVGLLIALLKARTQKVYVGASGKKVRSPNKSLLQSGVLLGALKIRMTLLQPMVVKLLREKGAKKGEERPRSRNW
jgi:hypothetical protein